MRYDTLILACNLGAVQQDLRNIRQVRSQSLIRLEGPSPRRRNPAYHRLFASRQWELGRLNEQVIKAIIWGRLPWPRSSSFVGRNQDTGSPKWYNYNGNE